MRGAWCVVRGAAVPRKRLRWWSERERKRVDVRGERRAGQEENAMILRLIFTLVCAAFEVLGVIALRQRLKEIGPMPPRRPGQRR